MNEGPESDGYKHWMAKLQAGMPREDIYRYFISVAQQENQNHQPQQDFWSLLDKTTGRKRAILIIKESVGDVLMCSQLFESFHIQHPNHDLYVMTDPKYFEVLAGNPYVFKVLPYVQPAEQELIMIGAGSPEGYFDLYMHPAIGTQRILNYLSNDNPAYQLDK